MRNTSAAVALVASAALLWVAVSSGQDVRPTPGPGPGYVTVKGTVDIGTMPSIRAIQEGEWKVALPGGADVRVTKIPSLDFLTVGRRYNVTWPGGRTEAIVVAQLGPGGWTRVEFKPEKRRRWVNLAGAEAVEELET